MKSFSNKVWIIAFCGVALMLRCYLGQGAETMNDGAKHESGEVWGTFSNEFCSGLAWELSDNGRGGYQDEVVILVKTSRTNGLENYFGLPWGQVVQAELRDANGALVLPIKGKKLDAGELPQRILAKDWPRTPPQGRNGGGLLVNYLMYCPKDRPVSWPFSMQDIYHIQKDGNYTFTIWMALYRYTDDKQAMVRFDLPSVSLRMHLVPSAK
jgi:hypothetical protein